MPTFAGLFLWISQLGPWSLAASPYYQNQRHIRMTCAHREVGVSWHGEFVQVQPNCPVWRLGSQPPSEPWALWFLLLVVTCWSCILPNNVSHEATCNTQPLPCLCAAQLSPGTWTWPQWAATVKEDGEKQRGPTHFFTKTMGCSLVAVFLFHYI